MLDLAVLGGRLVIPNQGVLEADLGVVGEQIAVIAVRGALPEVAHTLDATDRYVLPGLVDAHAHFGNFVPFARDAATETREALLGGVTRHVLAHADLPVLMRH